MMFSERKKLPVILEQDEAKKLLLIPNKRYPTGLRNKAMLALMVNLGLRVSEVANLKLSDINLSKSKLRVVDGKNGKDRDLLIPIFTLELLKLWNKKRINSIFFFDTLKGKKLSTRYIQAMVGRCSKKAGIKKNVTPHTLRHTFATEFYRQTKDIETLKRLLGHTNINTTQIYITLANIDVENAMNSFREFVI